MSISRYSLFQVLTRTIKTMFQVQPLASIFITFMIVCNGVSIGLTVWLVKQTLDSAIHFAQSPSFFWQGPGKWLIYLGVLSIGNSILFKMGIYIRSMAEKKMKRYLKVEIFSKTADLPLADFEDANLYDRIQRANQGLDIFFMVQFMTFGQVGSAVIGMISISVVVVSYSWLLLVALLMAGVPSLIAHLFFANKEYEVNYAATQKKRLAEYLKGVLVQRGYAKEVRLFGIGDYLTDKWLNTMQSFLLEKRAMIWNREKRFLMIQIVSSLFFIVCIFVIAESTIQQTITIGLFVALIQAVQQFQAQLNLLFSQFGFLVESSKHVGDAYAFLEEVPAMNQYDQQNIDGMPYSIEFDDVSFKYPGATEFALQELSFVIKPGERIALLGENGSGKTTLTKLLLGLFVPTQGVIRINGIDMNKVDPSVIRKNMTAVFQDYVCYQLRFRENIGFGQVNNLHEDARLFEAVNQLGMSDFIKSTDSGLDTQLGNQFSQGTNLSGGQWQRLALARAHLHDNPLLTVMDEPTSALDPRAESELYKQFSRIGASSTTIFVSHRMGLARLADHIFFLQAGKMVEAGSHDQLMKANSFYASFFKSQARWYQVESDANN